jgi:HEAT repeat protein
MNKFKSIVLLVASIILSIFIASPTYSKSYDDFINDYKKALDSNFTEEQLNVMFNEYSPLLTPHSDVSTFFNELKGTRVLPYPLEEFKTTELYNNSIHTLLISPNQNHRILAYLVIAASNENKYNNVLLERIKTEKNKGNRIWAGMALLYLKDNHTTELFDFLVNDEEFGDAHMLPLYIKLDPDLLRETAYIKIQSDNTKAKILAASILGVTGLNKKTEDILKKAVTDWPIDIKGYAIYSLKSLNAGNLLNTLKPYLDKSETRQISLQALANSPTLSDQNYILSLIPSENKIPNEILKILVNSTNKILLEEWLKMVQTNRISDDYSSSINLNSYLLSEEMRLSLLKAIPNIKNSEILADIANKLRGDKYYNTEDILISLLKHKNDSVRYWAASSLKGCKSIILAKMLPELLKSPSYRTVGLTKLILENNISNLQSIYEEILAKEGSERDWRRDCIEYLSKYPLEKHKLIFIKHLSDEKEDWSIRRDAALGLGRLKDINSVELIIKVMKEKRPYQNNDYNMISYIRALAMIKGETAKKAIEKYRNSEEDMVKILVKEILEQWDQ